MYALKYWSLRLITYPFRTRLAIVLSISFCCLALCIASAPMFTGILAIIPLLLTCFLFKYRGFTIIILCILSTLLIKNVTYFGNSSWHGAILFVTISGLVYFTTVGLFVCVLRHTIDLLLESRQQIIQAEHAKLLAYAEQQKALEAEKHLTLAYEHEQHINQQKDLFLAHVNHELCTPLVSVLGYLELLVHYHEQLSENKKISYMHKAMESTQELNALVTNLLDTAQLSAHYPSPHPEQVSLIQITREVLATWDPRDLHDFTFSVDIPAELIGWTDRRFFAHILRNLLSNACKYAPKNTTIRIIASTITFKDLPEICLSVRDEGKGIPPDQASLLFERFVRLPQDMVGTVRGTGLGLYICKEFVEAQGGRIWIESSAQPDKGSCFCFTLPATNPAPLS
jgi:signal transduction histidine kinase